MRAMQLTDVGTETGGIGKADAQAPHTSVQAAAARRCVVRASHRVACSALQAGFDLERGFLRDIQTESPATGHVFAKTGTYALYDRLNRRLPINP